MANIYESFVDLGYRPKREDLICSFYIEPAHAVSMKTAAGAVASESSIGTWTALTTMTKRIESMGARVFSIDGKWVKIAYPSALFEPGNMPQIWSSIAGNIFGMKIVDSVRLEDVKWPPKIINSFCGPQFGISGIRKLFNIRDRPLTASVPKPKIGMSTTEHAHIAYETWMGGFDLVKDDENLSSQSFNRFDNRLKAVMKMRAKAERETGEKKSYLINITAETREMLRRMKAVSGAGNEYVMVDMMTAGLAGLQTVREAAQDLKLAIHAHRAFHAAFSRSRRHGVSMMVVADTARLIGVDQIHIGTVVGKLESPKSEVLALDEEMEQKFVQPKGHILSENWGRIKPVFPVASGGLHPGLIPVLLRILGNNIIIQVGGGVHGHPEGTRAGCRAVRQAIDAALQNVPLKEYARAHPELRAALNMWGTQPFS